MLKSYDWITQYLKIGLSINFISDILSDSGLEVENFQEINFLDKNLKQIILGKINSFELHPYNINFNILKVIISNNHMLQIICRNNLFFNDKKVIISIFLDKNGVNSYGFFFKNKSIGLQNNNNIFFYKRKILANEFIKMRKYYSIGVEITTNRVDVMSHWGLARELYTLLNSRKYGVLYKKSSVEHFYSLINSPKLLICINELCRRYSGCIISGIKISPSPFWLRHRLHCIGMHTNNNIIDIINYVIHELGQPIHVYDIKDINGKEIYIKNLQKKINGLLANNPKKNIKDLMIYDSKKNIGLAGIFYSNVNKTSKDILIESSYLEPLSIRKSLKKKRKKNYSSFLLERGVDTEQIIYPIKRAAILIKEIAGGNIYAPTNLFPTKKKKIISIIRYNQIHFILGIKISKSSIKKIIYFLEIDFLRDKIQSFKVSIPSYRVDIFREVDLIEEILRIYGHNQIRIPNFFYFSKNRIINENIHSLENDISTLLNAQGFYEIVNISLTKYEFSKFFTPIALSTIKLLNPISNEIAIMRESLIFGLLEKISFNKKKSKLKFFEWGNVYKRIEKKYDEKKYLGLIISGKEYKDHWVYETGIYSFFYLKGLIEGLLKLNGIRNLTQKIKEDRLLEHALLIYYKNDIIIKMGRINNKIIKSFNLKQDIFYAEINSAIFLNFIQNDFLNLEYKAKFLGKRRDLALLLDCQISFEEIYQKIKSSKFKIINDIQLFDIYQGTNLPKDKKSYALSLYFKNSNKKLTESKIIIIMNYLQKTLTKKLGIQLRI